MGEWAILLRWGAAGILGLCLVLYGRGCGKDAGLSEGEQARKDLQAEIAALTAERDGCVTSLNFVNHVAEQEAAEAERQKHLADAAKARALEAELERDARVAEYERLLDLSKQNPDAAAQLRMVLHPAIPLR